MEKFLLISENEILEINDEDSSLKTSSSLQETDFKLL